MIDTFRKSGACAFAIISIVFTFVPETVFARVALIPENTLSQFTWVQNNISEINIILNRVISFLIIWAVSAIVCEGYRYGRNSIKIKGCNYKIVVEYGDLLKTKKCKRVINFDECFTTQVGTNPAEIKPSSVCGQYLNSHPYLDIRSLISNANLKPLKSKSKYHHKERYEPGRLVPNGDDLLLAFAKLDKSGLGKLTRNEYLECLSILWEEIDKYYGQKDVCIPILGAGVTRMDGGSGAAIPKQELLDMMIWSYRLSSHKIKSPYKLRIICKRSEDFSLDKIDSQV